MMRCAATIAVFLCSFFLPSSAIRVRGANELAPGASFCQLGYSCLTADTVQATQCLCKTLGYLHESAMPYDDKVAMLQALQDKNEDKLVRMRYRQTSRNLLMNMFGSNRNDTGTIAQMVQGSCETSGYTPIELKKPVPLGVGSLKLSIQQVDEKLFNYRKAKIQNIAPAVAQAVQYGEKMNKDLFLQEAVKKCVSGDDAEPSLTFGE